MMNEDKTKSASEQNAVSDSKVTRADFLARAAKFVVGAGATAAAPVILDKFLVPPVYAAGSRMSAPGAASDYPTGFGSDTSTVRPSA